MKAKVYFSREITPEKVVALYRAVGRELPGRVAVKLHSGEQGNQNFLGPDFWRPMIEAVHGTVVECNTAYEGERNTTEKHRRTMIKHGWSTKSSGPPTTTASSTRWRMPPCLWRNISGTRPFSSTS